MCVFALRFCVHTHYCFTEGMVSSDRRYGVFRQVYRVQVKCTPQNYVFNQSNTCMHAINYISSHHLAQWDNRDHACSNWLSKKITDIIYRFIGLLLRQTSDYACSLLRCMHVSDKRSDPLTIPCDEAQAHVLNKLIVLVTKLLKKLASDRYQSAGAARAGANRKHK